MDHEQAIEEFISSAGGTREIAEQYLEMTNWSVQPAVQAFIMDNEEEDDDEDEPTADTSGPAQASGRRLMGGRRLGDGTEPVSSAPQPSSSASTKSSRTPQQPKKMFGSLSDLQSGGQSGSHGPDDDDSDKEQEFFTGGDKSGLAVQDPRSRDHIQRLMETAKRHGPPPKEEGDGGQSSRSAFTGAGQTLGGDDVESQPVPAQNPQGSNRPPPMVERTLHMWADGFSVDDGPLYRYDDPANARTLDMINNGSAPLAIMNVEPGQAVDVKLDAHRGENYVQPKQKYKPFSGGGNRLGSPVPGASSSSSGSATTGSTAGPATSAQAPSQPSVDIDEAQPTVTLQIRLADGTRLPSRFNTTHTIGDVYTFVDRASSGSSGRAYTLATTFPTKELVDKDQVLGDMAEFKRGGVVVQKWS